MNLYLEDEVGNRTQVREVGSVGEGDLIIFLHSSYRAKDIEDMEKYFSEKFERKVIVLDGRVAEIMTVPPKIESTKS